MFADLSMFTRVEKTLFATHEAQIDFFRHAVESAALVSKHGCGDAP